MRSRLKHIAFRLRGEAKGLGSLLTATSIVVVTMTYAMMSIGGPAPYSDDPQPGAPMVRETEPPTRQLKLYINGTDLVKPLVYIADIEVAGWRDRANRLLEMRIETAHALEDQSVLPSEEGGIAQARDFSHRLTGQRVLASVDEHAAAALPTNGRAKVRLVVTPKDESAGLVIDRVVEPPAAVAASAFAADPGDRTGILVASSAVPSGARVNGLSAYAGKPGSIVTMSGQGFGTSQGKSWVSAGGTRAFVSAWADTSITFVVPSGMNDAGYIGVVKGGRVSNGLYFSPGAQPQLDAITPRDAVPGTIITLTGCDFGSKQRAGWVTVAGVSAEVVSWTDREIRVVVPRAASVGYVGVIAFGQTSNGVLFAPHGAPVVDPSTTRRLLLAGDTVTVRGRNFGSRGRVVLGGASLTPVSWSATRVTFVVPLGAPAGYLGVVRGDKMVSNGVWVWTAPRVTRLSRWWAAPGDELVIEGVGLGTAQGGRSVYVGGVAAQRVERWTDNAVTVVVPEGAGSGYVGVGTRNACSNGLSLRVERPAQVIRVTPETFSSGTEIVVEGNGFGAVQGPAKLVIGGVTVPTVDSWSDTRITARAPACPSGYIGVVRYGVSSNGVWLCAR